MLNKKMFSLNILSLTHCLITAQPKTLILEIRIYGQSMIFYKLAIAMMPSLYKPIGLVITTRITA